MHETNKSAGIEARREPRVDHDGQVTIELAAVSLVGSGQNISTQGVFFAVDGKLPVVVRIEGKAEPVAGQLVRLESMGDGRIGIAVRFDQAHPDLVS